MPMHIQIHIHLQIHIHRDIQGGDIWFRSNKLLLKASPKLHLVMQRYCLQGLLSSQQLLCIADDPRGVQPSQESGFSASGLSGLKTLSLARLGGGPPSGQISAMWGRASRPLAASAAAISLPLRPSRSGPCGMWKWMPAPALSGLGLPPEDLSWLCWISSRHLAW